MPMWTPHWLNATWLQSGHWLELGTFAGPGLAGPEPFWGAHGHAGWVASWIQLQKY